MKLRKRKSTQVVCMDEELEDVLENLLAVDELSAQSAERFELREAIESALVALPDDYRAIFIMRDVDRLSNEDVASYMGLSVPAVKSRLHRSRLFLRKRLQKLFTEQSEYTPMVLSRASNMGRGMSKEQ